MVVAPEQFQGCNARVQRRFEFLRILEVVRPGPPVSILEQWAFLRGGERANQHHVETGAVAHFVACGLFVVDRESGAGRAPGLRVVVFLLPRLPHLHLHAVCAQVFLDLGPGDAPALERRQELLQPGEVDFLLFHAGGFLDGRQHLLRRSDSLLQARRGAPQVAVEADGGHLQGELDAR